MSQYARLLAACWPSAAARTAAICAAFAAVLLATTPATAVVLGSPGAPSPAFSARMSAGFGYTARALDNSAALRDRLRRFSFYGRLSLMATDWLELIGIVGGADGRRSLTDFSGNLGIGGGGSVRFYLMRQEDFEINVGLGGGAEVWKNKGNSPDPAGGNILISDQLKERQFHGQLVLSRAFQTWNLYGGFVYNYAQVRQRGLGNAPAGTARNEEALTPYGLVVGVDYFVTPLVYFNLEGQNFHEDSIFASVGVLLAP